MPSFYCHQCHSNVDASEDLVGFLCADCNGTFVEQLSNDDEDHHSGLSSESSDGIDDDVIVVSGANGSDNEMDDEDSSESEFSEDDDDDSSDIFESDGDEESGHQVNLHILVVINGQDQQDIVATATTSQGHHHHQTTSKVSNSQLQRLPIAKVSKEQSSNGASCVTCMEKFKTAEKVASLECKHIFHRDCIVPWLKKSLSCPVCRRDVKPNKW